MSGPQTFHTLIKQDTTNDATDRTLTMPAATVITINTALTLDGLDANDRAQHRLEHAHQR
ncbi:MAG: hypothetical protein U0514_00080 [Candidatus Andersenbacteria bacterium]